MVDQEDHKTDGPEEAPKRGFKAILLGAMLAGVLGLGAGVAAYWLGNPVDGKAVIVAKGQEDAATKCAYSKEEQARVDGSATGHVAAFKALDRPYSTDALPFKNKDGASKTLADWKGRTVLLNLWATWCAPCRAEMPALDQLQADLGSDTFEVVAVSVDLGDDIKPRRFYDSIGIKSMAFYHDGEMESLNTLKRAGLAYGLPATLLIDDKGCVRGALNGPAEWATDDAKRLVRSIL